MTDIRTDGYTDNNCSTLV